MQQVSFPAFAAFCAASICPPADTVQTDNDVFPVVAHMDASSQWVDTTLPLVGTGHSCLVLTMRRDFDWSFDSGCLDAPDSLPYGAVEFWSSSLGPRLAHTVCRP